MLAIDNAYREVNMNWDFQDFYQLWIGLAMLLMYHIHIHNNCDLMWTEVIWAIHSEWTCLIFCWGCAFFFFLSFCPQKQLIPHKIRTCQVMRMRLFNLQLRPQEKTGMTTRMKTTMRHQRTYLHLRLFPVPFLPELHSIKVEKYFGLG